VELANLANVNILPIRREKVQKKKNFFFIFLANYVTRDGVRTKNIFAFRRAKIPTNEIYPSFF
jgi:hypothetical protein